MRIEILLSNLLSKKGALSGLCMFSTRTIPTAQAIVTVVA